MKPYRMIPFLTVAVCQVAPAFASPDGPGDMKCAIGPITKEFGGAQWLVYSCEDRKSIVIKSAPSNKAVHFRFSFMADEDGFALEGKGQGDKHVTDAAYRELNAMTEEDVASLVRETQQVPASSR